MTVPTSINDLSTTSGSNSPAGGDPPTQGDDFFRAYGSFLATLRDQLNGTLSAGTLKSPVFSGTATGTYNLGGIPSFTSNPLGKVTSAAFICTATAISNASPITVRDAYYMRIGDYVSMAVQCVITTSAGGSGQFYLSLPIASSFAALGDATGSVSGILGLCHGNAIAETTGDRLDCSFNAVSTYIGAMTVSVNVLYKII